MYGRSGGVWSVGVRCYERRVAGKLENLTMLDEDRELGMQICRLTDRMIQ